jgi:hypothetical protein
MGYLEAPLSLNPSDREPKTTIVARVMLGTVLTTVAELALPPRWCGLSAGSDIGFLLRLDLAHKSWLLPRDNEATLQQGSPVIFIQHKLVGPSQLGQ